ncbi:hypothetical protein PITCH_A350015 [uncultured Desulfobacterium sp.]|uniref:Uncharacterized protein n=1 Tax=uncultured Desulfobacterium sp. TaxID=201089 RepID=A0A445MZA1_9BACT|nr:hypothetical protein PITCH_A350015 [uncultured Desulfobacterium sp.]
MVKVEGIPDNPDGSVVLSEFFVQGAKGNNLSEYHP